MLESLLRAKYFSGVYLVVVELTNAALANQVWDVDDDGRHLFVLLLLFEIHDLVGSIRLINCNHVEFLFCFLRFKALIIRFKLNESLNRAKN